MLEKEKGECMEKDIQRKEKIEDLNLEKMRN